MPRYLLTLLIAIACATLGPACKKSPENSQKPANGQTQADARRQSVAAQASVAGQQASAAPTAAQPPSADAVAVQASMAGGDWEAAFVSGRKALWMHPEDQQMPAMILEAASQRAMQASAKNLAAGEWDAALGAAEIAVAHRPDSKEAADLLHKARHAIGDAHPYFGKYLRLDTLPIPSADSWWQGLNPQIIHLSSDGKTLIACALAETAVIDLENRDLRKLSSRGVYSPATDALILATAVPRSMKRVDLKGKTLWEAESLSPLGFSPDGRKIAALRPDAISIVDVETGRIISTTPVPGPHGLMWSGFASDGSLAAYAAANGPWTVFETEKGTVVHTFPSQAGYTAAFGRDGRFAFSSDTAISVVDTATWNTISTIAAVGRCQFTEDGKAVAVQDRTLSVAFYEPEGGKRISGPFKPRRLSPDGSIVFATSYSDTGTGLDAFRVGDGKQIGHVDDFPTGRAVAVGTDGRLLATTFEGITILSPPVWPDSTAISTFPPHSLQERRRGSWFIDLATGKLQTGEFDVTIARLKKTYGIDILVTTEAANLPAPEGLQGFPMPSDSGATSEQAVRDHVARYLRDQELTGGVPGFYLCFIDSPRVVACEWYPGAAKSPLDADEAKKLGAMVAAASIYNCEEVFRQFIVNLERTLQQKYP